MGIAKKLKEAASKKKDKQKELVVNDQSIVSLNNNDVRDLLNNMLQLIHKVDFSDIFVNRLNDPLVKYQDKKKNISLAKIPRALYAVAIMEELKTVSESNGWDLAQQDGMLYLYNKKYWVKVEEGDIKEFLSEATIRMGYYSPAEAKSRAFSDLLFKQFHLSSYSSSVEQNGDNVFINLENGTYEITALGACLREHRKEDFLTYCLPFSFDKQEKAPIFNQYLDRVLPDASSQRVLQEFMGYVFVRHLKLEKALILLGGGQNGKSVFFEVVSALLGPLNISTKSLGDLVDKDSGNDNRAKLKDKLVNYGSEISSRGMDVDMFKRLVSGEPVAAREKYKTSFDLKNNCKFIFNANKLPVEIEHTDAYFRRFIIIPFRVTISELEKDPELHSKIIHTELPGVLNWVIEGLNRLMQNKKFSECEAANKELATYKKESNSVALMVEEEGLVDGYTVDREYRMSNKKLYDTYREFCSESGMRAMSRVNFSKELKNLGFAPYRSGKERGFIIKYATE